MIKPETKAYNTFAELVKQWMRAGEHKQGMIEQINNRISICQTHVVNQEDIEYYAELEKILKRFLVVLVS